MEKLATLKLRLYTTLAAALVSILLVLGLTAAILVAGVFSTGTKPSAAAVCNPIQGSPGEVPEAPADVLAEQIKNAQLIDRATQAVGLSGQASRIAIIAAMGESSLINVNYGDQDQGVTNPDGSPATSYGLFQQQVSQGWGTKKQVMNPEHATKSFLLGPKHDGNGGLISVQHWEETTYISSIIWQVQGNQVRDHYTSSIAPADNIITKAGIDTSRPAKAEKHQSVTVPGDTGDSAETCGSSGSIDPTEANDDYPYTDITPPGGVYVADEFGYYYGECTSFVAWRINRDAGSTSEPYKFTAANGNFANGNAYEWKEAWLARGWKVSSTPVPGAVAWWGANGGPGIGKYGHVAYVQDVTDDGKVIIEEYNNPTLAGEGHKYSIRPNAANPDSVNAYLYPPPVESPKKK